MFCRSAPPPPRPTDRHTEKPTCPKTGRQTNNLPTGLSTAAEPTGTHIDNTIIDFDSGARSGCNAAIARMEHIQLHSHTNTHSWHGIRFTARTRRPSRCESHRESWDSIAANRSYFVWDHITHSENSFFCACTPCMLRLSLRTHNIGPYVHIPHGHTLTFCSTCRLSSYACKYRTKMLSQSYNKTRTNKMEPLNNLRHQA